MDKLKQIIEDKEIGKDSDWHNLYETDIRNLFPKYQLSKIEKAKNKFDKFRLIMENIQDFLFIQQHRKQSKKLNQQVGNLKTEIQEIEKQQNSECQYNLDIIKYRDSSDSICQQLIKYGNQVTSNRAHKNLILQQIINQAPKWQQYYTKSCKKINQYNKEHKFAEKVQLAQTVCIPNNYEDLNQSTPSQILYCRLKDKYLNKKLLEKWISPPEKREEIEIDRQFLNQWKKNTNQIDYNQLS